MKSAQPHVAPEWVRDRLLARHHEVVARYRTQRALVEEELDSREIDFLDRAAEDWDATVQDSLGQADSRRLIRIAAALRRLDDGNYGVCVICRQRISDDRLASIPEAETCIECARSRGVD